MKQVYQRIIDPTRGDCFKCTICTILGLDYDSVPNFIELPGNEWYTAAEEVFRQHGFALGEHYRWNPNIPYLEYPTSCCSKPMQIDDNQTLKALTLDDGIDGLFMASVYSPKYTEVGEHPMNHLHSVLCDINFNIVFDPNPEYEGVLEYPYAHLIGYNGIRGVDTIRHINTF